MSTLSADTSTSNYSNFTTLASNIINKKNVSLANKNSSSGLTYSVNDIFDGGIIRNGNSSSVTDFLPTATEIRNEMASRLGYLNQSLPVRTCMDFIIFNNGSAAITLANSTNLTFYGRTIVQANRAIKVRVIITNNFGIVLAEAFTLYGYR
ncbi:MAG: hypothetical protein GY823_06150 [Flavobacteriaceae bacterium]|nr:hypothetical protein [Flavobacteriaceae bacterium]